MTNPFSYFNIARGHPAGGDDVLRYPCRCETSRSPNVGLTSTTRPSGSGGAALARCSPPRPDLFPAVIGLSVSYYGARTTFTYIPPSQSMRREVGPEGFHYQLYFSQVGRAEADIEKDVPKWLGGFFHTLSADAPPEEIKLAELKNGDRLEDAFAWPKARPAWMSDTDLDHYAAEFERTGFQSALNFYRAADLTWHEMAPWRDAKITVPGAFISSDRDVVVVANPDIVKNFPSEVPDSRGNLILPQCGHWTKQEGPRKRTSSCSTSLRTGPRRARRGDDQGPRARQPGNHRGLGSLDARLRSGRAEPGRRQHDDLVDAPSRLAFPVRVLLTGTG
jgi:hypothetical protein